MKESDDVELPRTPREALRLAGDMLRSMRRAFVMLWATDARLTLAVATLSVLAAFVPAAMAWVAKAIVDGIVRAVASGAASDRAEVIRYLALELGLAALALTLHRAASVASTLLRARFTQHVSERVVEKTLSLSLADFEDPEMLDRLNRAREGGSYRLLELVQGLFGFGQDVLTLVAYGGIMASVAGWMQLLIVAAAVPEFIVQTRLSQDGFRLFEWRSPETRRQRYYEAVLTQASAVKEVRLFELGPLFLGRYKEIFARFWREDRDLAIRRGLWGVGLGVASNLAFYASYGVVVWRAMAGVITLGGVALFVGAFKRAQETVTSLLFTAGNAYEDHIYLAALFDFLDHTSADAPSGTATEGPRPEDGVRFEGVSFTYPGAAQATLTDVTLHIPRGHKLALVGENGAGKTTLIKLLTRLYRPTAGRITLDGLDLAAWDDVALRRRIGVIFQDFVQYQLTVGENIGVGDVRAFDDEARWREAAERAMADAVVEGLPKGYQTQLGKWFDDGRDLSLGQWQKVALARAFMRRDADLLVLDEPTASLDAAAEAQVFERFRALTEHRTAVVISHRFSTVRMADTIAVLAGGTVVERGTHDELLARGGRYAELFFLQAKGYR